MGRVSCTIELGYSKSSNAVRGRTWSVEGLLNRVKFKIRAHTNTHTDAHAYQPFGSGSVTPDSLAPHHQQGQAFVGCLCWLTHYAAYNPQALISVNREPESCCLSSTHPPPCARFCAAVSAASGDAMVTTRARAAHDERSHGGSA